MIIFKVKKNEGNSTDFMFVEISSNNTVSINILTETEEYNKKHIQNSGISLSKLDVKNLIESLNKALK